MGQEWTALAPITRRIHRFHAENMHRPWIEVGDIEARHIRRDLGDRLDTARKAVAGDRHIVCGLTPGQGQARWGDIRRA